MLLPDNNLDMHKWCHLSDFVRTFEANPVYRFSNNIKNNHFLLYQTVYEILTSPRTQIKYIHNLYSPDIGNTHDNV